MIIVGAGSGYCLLAHRLSEDPARNILLLEAGHAYLPDNYPDRLADADQLGDGAEYDWGYQVHPADSGIVSPHKAEEW